MTKDIVAYFASEAAFKLWLSLSFIFLILATYQGFMQTDETNIIKTIFLFTDLVHFWMPIVACKYLYRLHQENEDES